MPADMQERILAETGTQHESSWRKNYFMPAQADRHVTAPMFLPFKNGMHANCALYHDTTGSAVKLYVSK